MRASVTCTCLSMCDIVSFRKVTFQISETRVSSAKGMLSKTTRGSSKGDCVVQHGYQRGWEGERGGEKSGTDYHSCC